MKLAFLGEVPLSSTYWLMTCQTCPFPAVGVRCPFRKIHLVVLWTQENSITQKDRQCSETENIQYGIAATVYLPFPGRNSRTERLALVFSVCQRATLHMIGVLLFLHRSAVLNLISQKILKVVVAFRNCAGKVNMTTMTVMKVFSNILTQQFYKCSCVYQASDLISFIL